MTGILTNILRTAMIAFGTWLVNKYGVDDATVQAATEQITNILGAIIAGGGAIWSLLRAIRRSKDGVK